MTIEKEVVIEFNRMAIDHIGVLWKVGVGLVALEIMMVAHLIKLKGIRLRRTIVIAFLIASVLLSGVSIAAGYLSESALISHMQDFAAGNEWTVSYPAEFLVSAQMICVVLGLIVFIGAFMFYASVLADVLIEVGGIHLEGRKKEE
jgi:hypothetical protein